MIATNIAQATSLPFSYKYVFIIPASEVALTTLQVFTDTSPKAYAAKANIQQD